MGTLVNNLEIQPGKGSEYIRAAGNLSLGILLLSAAKQRLPCLAGLTQ